MPIYIYGCNKCGDTSEVLRKITDPPIKHCFICKSKDSMRKIVANGQFRFRKKDKTFTNSLDMYD